LSGEKNRKQELAMLNLIHHAASGSHDYPPSSLSAIKQCLNSNCSAIEIDILPIADGSFVLLHDPDLEVNTSGKGNALSMTREDLSELRYRKNGQITDERLGFLDQVIPLVADNLSLGKLQLDFKPFAVLSPALIGKLLDIIKPIKERVQISSVADWAIRALSHLAPELDLGFDPLLYLDVVSDEIRPATIAPFRIGAYGMLDDHPLSGYVWGSKAEYFNARAEVLFSQAVAGCEWFIRAETILAAYETGFNWIDFLHDHDCIVDAWTLEPQGHSAEMAKKLYRLGIDEITSNDAVGMAKLLA